MYPNYRIQDFFFGAFVGGAIGALTTMLFTTQKGKQLQKGIADKYEELKENVKETANNVADKAEKGIEKMKG